MWAENGGGPFSCCLVTTDTSGCCGSKAAGRGRAQPMGDRQQNSLYSHRTPEAEDGPERAQDGGTLGLQGTVYESRGSRDPKHQDLGDGDLGLEDQEEETLPEVVTGEESVDTQNPEEALLELERVLEKDAEDGVPEMSRLSISQRTPGTPVGRERRKRRRLFQLAKPKTNWQVWKDRTGCCCRGYAWISPNTRDLQFCVYWPSVYWTERFLEDTTLAVTVPEVSRRVEELARPKRFCSAHHSRNRNPSWRYFGNRARRWAVPEPQSQRGVTHTGTRPPGGWAQARLSLRTTPTWPVPRSTLEYRASRRLRDLATPKVRDNIWSIHMSEVSHVSRAAQVATPSPRIIRLAKPRAPATLLEEWDPMPKPKPHVSDYNRLLQLATPKAQSDKCVPDRDPRWEVLEVTKKAVASPRIVSLAKPKVRRDLNEGYDPYHISPASLVARASPRLYALATPKSITKKA
ncbi:testicular haploid expressed gene protein isoform X2 [Hippopotamus amphibius kiboko]|uniref:testicular haploid expressed gene protein isoform X2 n=1 Tax=Hippopotamus amphibius kiboko TaxID=575201 RepID=UPI002597CCA1|nr:testicular haploid expressed gene protein isoform X2 [Hippopotamus amphibius kiboko]